MPAAVRGSACGRHQPWRSTQPGGRCLFHVPLGGTCRLGPVGWLSVPEGSPVSGGCLAVSCSPYTCVQAIRFDPVQPSIYACASGCDDTRVPGAG